MAQQNRNPGIATESRSLRVANVNIPANKKIYVSLQSIFGIGEVTALRICKDLNIDSNKRGFDLTDQEIVHLRSHISQFYKVEGDLRREIKQNIADEISKNSYKGIRHRKLLPVRGQNTHSNARTRRGRAKPIANKKKVTK